MARAAGAPEPRTVLEAIDLVAAGRPQALALLALSAATAAAAAPERFGYERLLAASTLAARRLLAAAPAARRRAEGEAVPLVAVAVDEGWALPLVELAVLRAGCAVMPLDIEDPPARIAQVLEDAGPVAIVAKSSDVAAKLGEALLLLGREASEAYTTSTVLLAKELFDEASAAAAKQAKVSEAALPQPVPEDVSHVFFTSGSTGRPKGCVCTHANLLAYCTAKNLAHGIGPEAVVFVASAATFDPSLGDFFATWCVGGCVAVAPRARLLSSLAGALNAARATHVLTTPALWRGVREAPQALPFLRVLALGGEAMPRPLAEAWASSDVLLANTYGVTECCVYQAFAAVRPPALATRRVGAPFRGTRLALVAADGDDPTVEVEEGSGEAGELWIAGPQVGLGYLRRPELTAARFTKHSFTGDGGSGRCFRTGDVARAVADGWELLGRRDNQVKVNGRRVELGEIEEALLKVAGSVLEAVCVVLRQSMLVAFCVLSAAVAAAVGEIEEDEVLASTLHALLATVLPRAMCPARFVLRQTLPTTGTGKVSRSALAKEPLPDLGCGAGPPRPGWETAIAEAWMEELALRERPSRSAAFAALGGDSLAALRICHRLASRPEVAAAVAAAAATVAIADGETSEAPSGSGTAATGAPGGGGLFGEALGVLAPAELLRRPLLEDFAAYLRAALGAHPGGAVAEPPDADADPANELVAGAVSVSGAAAASAAAAALCRAAAAGQRWAVALLLDRGTPADGGFPEGRATPLHLACLRGADDVVATLLEARAAAGARAAYGRAPLHLAAQRCGAAALAALLRARASPLARDEHGQTPLHHAARAGAPAAVCEVLLFAVAEAEGKKSGGGKRPASAKVAGPAAGWLEWTDTWGRTALHWAAVNGHRGVVVRLIEAEANVKAKDSAGETALEIAERRALCAAGRDRPAGMGASVFGDLVTLLGGSAGTKNLKKYSK